VSYDLFESPFSTRYGSDAMRRVWSERHKRLLWRRLWTALAAAQADLGLVRPEQAADVRAHAADVDDASIARALEIEHEIRHDLMAEVRAFAEQCPIGGGIIHLGATSMDIEDNADALRLGEALDLILASLRGLLAALADQVERYADLAVMAFTHLQPAEPTTLGYRLAQTLQDLLMDLDALEACRAGVRGKGFKGAVGTSASYRALLAIAAPSAPGDDIERRVMAAIGLEAFPVATQTYPRKQDWLIVNGLAGLAQSLYKFAFDLRLLQSPPIGELAEPFGARQVGSSAMPFKRNPINAEKIDSLARYIAALPRVMWDNAAHSLLERTLDDSANRRVAIAEAFLAADEICGVATGIVSGLRVSEPHIARTMATYGPFAATEPLLMALVAAGADRQVMHEHLRERSLRAWADIAEGKPNPLTIALPDDAALQRFLSRAEIARRMDAADYVGDAPARARALVAHCRGRLSGPAALP